jgi:hypothetical protein
MSLNVERGSNGAAKSELSQRVVVEPLPDLAEGHIYLLRCRHFALEEDPDTSLLFPSHTGFCYRSIPPESPRLTHQQAHCLSRQHTGCPVFNRPVGAPLPTDLQEPQIQRDTRSRMFSRLARTLFLAMIVALLLGLGGQWIRDGLIGLQPAAAVAPTLAVSAALPAASDTQTVAAPVVDPVMVSPTPSLEPTATIANVLPPPPTATPLPSPTAPEFPTQTFIATPTPLPAITPSPTSSPPPKAVVLVTFLNVRTGPGLEYQVLGLAPLDAEYVVLARVTDNSWWQICCVVDKSGWVFGEAVTIIGTPAEIPVATDISAPP